ncbi:MAG: nucleotidyltransferase family protein [Acidimicrobiales bacterium]
MAVVLAAGGGRRFDGASPKLLAPFGGRPLVSWSVEAAAGAGLDRVLVVSGAVDLRPAFDDLVSSARSGASPGDRPVPAAPVTVVVNEDWEQGQASSLRVALGWCRRQRCRAAVVGLGDQPLVPSSAWRAVATAGAAPIVAATYGGRRRNPVRLDRSVWPLLTGDGDDVGARALMGRRPDLVHDVACEGDPDDVDTIADLRRLERCHPEIRAAGAARRR